MGFYGSDLGDRLILSDNYPESVIEFLEKERENLLLAIQKYDLVIEVGCMEGRGYNDIRNNGISYVGIDQMSEYIEKAASVFGFVSDTHEFLCMDAEFINEISKKSILYRKHKKILFFFPFNSFGNVLNINNLLSSFSKLNNADALIYTYLTDVFATNERDKYYTNCNYKELQKNETEAEVRFTSADGLNSVAYKQEYLKSLCYANALSFDSFKFCNVGIVYKISTKKE